MTWARLKVVADEKGGDVLEERVFNLATLLWWKGHGRFAELRYPGEAPIYVEMRDKRLEMLTGSSGHYASDY